MMKAIVALSLLGAANGAITPFDMSKTGLRLKEPTAVYSPRALDGSSTDTELAIELIYTTCDYAGPYTSFTTRCYEYEGEATFPGPTIYVKPGDSLTIKLTNTLSDKDDINYHNFFQHLNRTNLHFHGGHVSANAPGDDVLTMIPAAVEGEEYSSITYTYDIPDYHSPGTAWYHPHGHGSATLQTGTGSAGMIIIMDEDEVPSYIRDAPELLFNIDHFNLEQIIGWGVQSCCNQDIMAIAMSGPEGNLSMGEELGVSGILTVNGMTSPNVVMEAGVWYRMRYLMASTMFMVNGEGSGDADTLASCQFKLLAKDSIYILDGLRDISKFFLYPGARADLMAMCQVPGQLSFDSVYFEGQETLTHHVPNFIGNLFTLDIVNTQDLAYVEPDIMNFETQRPCYVTDTRSIMGDESFVTKKPIVYAPCEPYNGTVSTGSHRMLAGEKNDAHRKLAGSYNEDGTYHWEYDTFPGYSPLGMALFNGGAAEGSCEALADIGFAAKTGKYCQSGCAFEVNIRHPIGGDALMAPTNDAAIAAAEEIMLYDEYPCLIVNYDQYLNVGDIMEWDIWGIDFHPVHFHVNPYQLVSIDYELGNQAGVMFNESMFRKMTGEFFHEGDFGDVMMIPAKHVTLHQHLANFATVMVNHCHILLHEDLGMMQGWLIEGVDGTVTRAQEVDASCYWTNEEKTGYTITSTCDDDNDCFTGWYCESTSGLSHGKCAEEPDCEQCANDGECGEGQHCDFGDSSRRARKLRFGYSSTGCCH